MATQYYNDKSNGKTATVKWGWRVVFFRRSKIILTWSSRAMQGFLSGLGGLSLSLSLSPNSYQKTRILLFFALCEMLWYRKRGCGCIFLSIRCFMNNFNRVDECRVYASYFLPSGIWFRGRSSIETAVFCFEMATTLIDFSNFADSLRTDQASLFSVSTLRFFVAIKIAIGNLLICSYASFLLLDSSPP